MVCITTSSYDVELLLVFMPSVRQSSAHAMSGHFEKPYTKVTMQWMEFDLPGKAIFQRDSCRNFKKIAYRSDLNVCITRYLLVRSSLHNYVSAKAICKTSFLQGTLLCSSLCRQCYRCLNTLKLTLPLYVAWNIQMKL